MSQYNQVLSKQQVERDYTFRVEWPVPPDGLGKYLDVMSRWLGAGGLRISICTDHSHYDWIGTGEIPRRFTRFHLLDARSAELFAREFEALGGSRKLTRAVPSLAART